MYEIRMNMTVKRWLDLDFWVDVALLLLCAPLLYFPGYFPDWGPMAALGGLIVGLVWRRWRLGIWFQRTPIDWPLFFLMVVMLPISLWAAPAPMREEYSMPRAYILLWNLCLWMTVVTHASRRRELLWLSTAGFIGVGVMVALVAPLGIDWLYKFPGFSVILSRIPSPLVGVFAGAESGFHPNQVAGTLLHVLPLPLALGIAALYERRRWLGLMLLGAAALMGLVLLLTQSRGGLMGLAAGMLAMGIALLPRLWMIVAIVVLVGGLGFLMLTPFPLVELLSDAPPVEAVGGMGTLSFRQEVWTHAITGLHDFAFTGMGLGTFREIVRLLYPLNVDPSYDIGHAHNFFLQAGLDFGLPGMIALIAIYLVVFAVLGQILRSALWPWGIGLLGCLVAHLSYSMLDAVAMGAKTNVVWWVWLGVVLGAGGLVSMNTQPLNSSHTSNVCSS